MAASSSKVGHRDRGHIEQVVHVLRDLRLALAGLLGYLGVTCWDTTSFHDNEENDIGP